MPGFTLHLSRNGLSNSEEFQMQLKKLLYFPKYEQKIHLNKENLSLGSTTYKDYPFLEYSHGDYLILFEGHVYNANFEVLIEKSIQFINQELSLTTFESYYQELDFDLALVIYCYSSNKIYIFNDSIGRLPIYIYKGNESLIITRELNYIVETVDEISFSKLGIAHFQLFRYCLDTQTLYEQVEKLQIGSYLELDCSSLDFNTRRISVLNVSPQEFNSYEAKEIAEILNTAISNRLKFSKRPVLSLSGGLDSRVVLPELSRVKGRAATFSLGTGVNKEDVRVSELIANKYDIKFDIIPIPNIVEENIERILRIKRGTNPVSMAFNDAFFTNIGDVDMIFTGDGGDKVMPDLSPSKKLKSIDDLVYHILNHQTVSDVKVVCKLFNLSFSEIFDSIKVVVSKYPEESITDKYIHFQIRERGMNWLFEGEDRNRFYAWSVTPFYSQPLFRKLLNIAPSLKKDYILYKAVLNELDPILCDTINSNWGVSLNQNYKDYLLAKKLYKKIPSYNLKTWIRKKIKGEHGSSSFDDLLLRKYHGLNGKNDITSELKGMPATTKYNYLTLKILEAYISSKKRRVKM